MSLMSKLSLSTLLISANLLAATDAEVIAFLKQGIGKNPSIVSLELNIIEKRALENPAGWQAYMIELDGRAKVGGQEREVTQSMTYFVKDDIITKELINMKTGKSIADAMAPAFKAEYYKKENLVSGNPDAEHKVALFSDPLCPFCRRFIPEAMEYMRQYPETFAVYYYHMPLESLHPAAVTLTKAAIAAEHQGRKNVLEALYKIEINARESDDAKILDAFNKTLNSNITLEDIKHASVEAQFLNDKKIARTMMVNGTPTVFMDGKKDASKKLYQNVKVK